MAILTQACSENADPFALKVNDEAAAIFSNINSRAELLHSAMVPTPALLL